MDELHIEAAEVNGVAGLRHVEAGLAEQTVLAQGEASSGGSFTLSFTLPQEGEYFLTLRAEKEGYAPASASGQLTYEARLLPVNFTQLPTGDVTTDTTALSGTTLSGASIQLLSEKGLVTRRVGSSGAFSFELTSDTEGVHEYTLVVTLDGYDQRRIPITVTRVITDAQRMQAI